MTITITEKRQYIKDGDFCIYRDGDGYVYQDMLGYKTYKTLAGLNRHLANSAKRANREVVTVTD